MSEGDQPDTKLSSNDDHYRHWSVILWRSLNRLHLAVKECARVGFQESSPTTNALHAEIWGDLNAAQKDVALKLKAYSTGEGTPAHETGASEPEIATKFLALLHGLGIEHATMWLGRSTDDLHALGTACSNSMKAARAAESDQKAEAK